MKTALASIAATLLLASSAAASDEGSAILSARPPSVVTTPAAAGEILSLGEGAYGYVPANALPDEPKPLLVLFHGTGGRGRRMIEGLTDTADALGMVLLAPQARGDNWELVDNFFDDYERPRSSRGGRPYPSARYGDDVARVDRALERIFGQAEIDPQRIWLFGFSHGGSYALSLGSANPELFSKIAAVAPGLFLPPEETDSGQAFFIAHGRHDTAQRFALSEELFVPTLAARGHRVVFESFDGGHEVPDEIWRKSLVFFLSGPTDQSATSTVPIR